MPTDKPDIGTFVSSDVSAALDAAEDHVEILDTTDSNKVLVVSRRDDYKVEVHDLEKYQLAPSRPRGTVRAMTADGFTRAVDRRLDNDDTFQTVVYSDVDRLTLTAVLNDDHEGTAGWRDNRVEWTPEATPEWLHWTRNVGLHDQAVFAAIVEEGESDITQPASTVMLEIAQTFQASTEAKFKKVGRLRDGRTQFVYEEDVEAKAGEGEGDVAIPETFTVALRPFYGAEAVPVVCKLRWRLIRGDLSIGYTITRPQEIQREAFVAVVASIEDDALGHLLFVEGKPADPSQAGR